MVPSEDAIAKFIACVPDADEGKAWVFLEVIASCRKLRTRREQQQQPLIVRQGRGKSG
jgi:predicted Zn-dependent protease